jgi:lipid-binding SYLF domain-containing protein
LVQPKTKSLISKVLLLLLVSRGVGAAATRVEEARAMMVEARILKVGWLVG